MSRTKHAAAFANKLAASTVAMLLLTAAQVPAVIWYVSSATPACEQVRSEQAMFAAQAGLAVMSVAVLLFSVLLATRVLRLRWAWLWWGPVTLAAAAPAAAVAYLLPTLSPGTGGFFCL